MQPVAQFFLLALIGMGALVGSTQASLKDDQEVDRLWREFEVAADTEDAAPTPEDDAAAEDDADDSGEHRLANATNVVCELGYVFIDGSYLAPPYALSFEGGVVTVNGLPMRSHFPPADRTVRRFGRQRDPKAVAFQQLADWLEQDYVIVALADQPMVILGDPGARYDLFARLMKHHSPSVRDVTFTEQLPAELDHGLWRDWIARFTPTAGFRARASEVIAEYEASEARARSEIAATRRLNSMAYPLTVCGMIATTLAMGHLLSNRPPKVKSRLETDTSPETLSAVSWSLGLVIGLSALDLVWTILASQANQMRELNPLGSELISDPLKLVIFKTAAIGMAVGLLFGLRRYRQAQLGAWWAVLICTLLTVRWLTFNSMNVV